MCGQHESPLKSPFVEYSFLLFQLHPKVNSNLFGHFFNPYISLIVEDMNIVHNFIFNSIAIPNYEAFSFAYVFFLSFQL
jgi:hypothetical protein